ncbi:sodium-dependent transporter [Clostridium chauvoei]|uniref:Transporter n=3 Tax=Clostridium chauvoei TaxID=46867 RepID=S6F0C7_9CLOT|nr:sodium-dependent transporter [Clostridium chauvoei]ATD55327.1 sodium-dependent transporter [Clostridium chauvoei]ATD56998.1 sodium-dependent transporter [Clostridium chauvoei]MBX7280839.1 sodium-dependent transporter [Clostridium chauvoei]MBX7283322.1 sodium-dependent transporter [Clostridium chauvoei]MBX7285796.1 sodium-dependent transporter [Clostridium chauvoei]
MSRENFSSRLGLLAAAAGSAIGLGNIWKFPYITGQNGGAAFILVYLGCIFLIGIPVMLSEFAIGRKNQVNAVESFKKIAPNTKWHWTGYLATATAFIILSFYAIIAGWVFSYIWRSATGVLKGVSTQGFGDYFNALTSNPVEPMIMTLLVLVITAIIIFFGIKTGIEKFSKIAMPLLLGLIILLIIRSVTLPGAKAGLEFLFKPDFSNLSVKGILEALGHAFYTLSLGMGIILTFGSYTKKSENLVSLSYQVAIADTVIALMAGIVIFPAVFAYGLEPTAGPGLLFITLPAVFKAMPLGQLFEFMFFVLIAIAALTSTVSLMETVVTFVSEQFNLTRKKTIVIITSGLFALAIPSILSFGPLSHIKLLGDRGVFDTLDFVTGQIFLPIGGILICLFIAWVWGIKNAAKEISNDGSLKFKIKGIYSISVKYLAPLSILIIFLYGLGIFNIFK